MLLQVLALMAQEDDCPSSTPTLDSVVNTLDTIGTCFGGGSNHWQVEWLLTVTGSLQPGQQYLWEVATTAVPEAGDWGTTDRGENLAIDTDDSTLGTDGEGGAATHYRTVRVWVVPTGAGTDEACAGPVTSDTLSRAATSCVI